MTGSSEVSPVPVGPESGEAPSHQRWPRWLVAVLAAGVAVGLVAAALAGSRVLGWWGEDEPAAAPEASPSPTEPADPFAGTPAEDFAEGADGIVLPEAEPVGDFTADEVADALEQVRDALVAARLDPSVLVDHDLEELMAVLAPDQTAAVQTAVEEGGYGPFPTMMAPGAVPAPQPPRVDGRIAYEAATAGPRDSPIIQVVTRFVWVYPFEAGLVVVRDKLVWEVVLGRPWIESSRGVWIEDTTARAWGVDCEAYPDALRPAGEGERLTDDAIFDAEEPLDAVPGC